MPVPLQCLVTAVINNKCLIIIAALLHNYVILFLGTYLSTDSVYFSIFSEKIYNFEFRAVFMLTNVDSCINLLATDFFFQILAHPVFKM